MNSWTLKAHELYTHQANALAEALKDMDIEDIPTTYRTTAAGDQRKLRGIPAIGRGVTGAIPGTTPEARLISRERWRNHR